MFTFKSVFLNIFVFPKPFCYFVRMHFCLNAFKICSSIFSPPFFIPSRAHTRFSLLGIRIQIKSQKGENKFSAKWLNICGRNVPSARFQSFIHKMEFPRPFELRHWNNTKFFHRSLRPWKEVITNFATQNLIFCCTLEENYGEFRKAKFDYFVSSPAKRVTKRISKNTPTYRSTVSERVGVLDPDWIGIF